MFYYILLLLLYPHHFTQSDYHIIVPNQPSPVKMAKYALTQVRKTDPSIPENPKFTRVKGNYIAKDIANFEVKKKKKKKGPNS